MSDKTMKFVEEQINKDEILNKLLDEFPVEDMLNYNEFDVMEKLPMNPYYTEQFRLLYLSHLGKLERVEMMLEEKLAELYTELKNGEVALTKVEIEKYYIPKDDKVMSLRRTIAKQKIRVGFFEAVYKAFDKQGWQMKQFINKMGE